MEKLKFALFSIVILSLLGLLGYWSVMTIQSGTDHVNTQKIKELQKENEDLNLQVKSLNDKVNDLQAKLVVPAPVVPDNTQPVTYKYQSLIDELQKLISDNVTLKQHSSGSRVGTVQKFFNVYSNTSTKVDNDYGGGTVRAVTAFQKDMGLTANGTSDFATFGKMIEWLKKQK